MDHTVRLEHVGRRPLAVVRRRARPAELSRVVPDACGTVWGVVRSQQVPGAGRNVAVYWDCQDGQISLEVGVELDAPFAGHGEVIASATPAGRVAAVTHLGPYGGLHAAHDAIRAWCRATGAELAGPSWEVYGHWQEDWTRDPSLIRTDVFYLLAGEEPPTDESSAG